MRLSRPTLVVALTTFALVTIMATYVLGNTIGSNPCAGWTGYVPLGSCVTTFASAAFYIGPLIGLIASAIAAVVTDRVVRRARSTN